LETKTEVVNLANSINLNNGLTSNRLYLNRINPKTYNLVNGPKFNSETLKNLTQNLYNSTTLNLAKFKLYKLSGENNIGNVHYTSYYIPTLEVSKIKDSLYKFPIYKCPKSDYLRKLSRYEIDINQKLKNKGLVLGYAKNYFDLFSMMIQGSGNVIFKDGTTKLFSYAGKNNKPYYSIGRYLASKQYISLEKMSLTAIKNWFELHPDSTHIFMMNKSYVYFKPKNNKPTGACGVPLIENCSVAADFKYLPKGSILLGKTPVLSENGEFIKHEYKILLVHDTGSAIKGTGHIDLYAGEGKKAKQYASGMHHYGELWLILPK
jgi:membrane-bound lytic murein transglycosylase A